MQTVLSRIRARHAELKFMLWGVLINLLTAVLIGGGIKVFFIILFAGPGCMLLLAGGFVASLNDYIEFGGHGFIDVDGVQDRSWSLPSRMRLSSIRSFFS